MTKVQVKGLRLLARLYGLQTEFVDSAGRRQQPSTETVLGVLKALGAPLGGPADVAEATRARRAELRSRRIEPVALAWDDSRPEVILRLPGSSSGLLDCLLTTEAGDDRRWAVPVGDLEADGSARTEGDRLVGRRLSLPGPLPSGYHRLRVEQGAEVLECLVIAAPRRAYPGPSTAEDRPWGLFCPLYALHRRSSLGAGDFSDLEALMDWTADRGGNLVATLPMLATTFGESPWVSPYSPASRLFWNEFYLDLRRLPELAESEPARALMDSAEFRREAESLRSESLVDYGRQIRLKRGVLERLAETAFAAGAERSPGFRRFLDDYPEAADYARFMAIAEQQRRPWPEWPDDLRDHRRGGRADGQATRYHLYVQWRADEQLRALSDHAVSRGLTWYVDYPVGVDAQSYDAWRRPEVFAFDASVGCPPDEDFTTGQDWGFPPQHPARQREGGYAYLIGALRNHLRHAQALRLDHVMGLHRLYWIPKEAGTKAGAYVTYPADELYAILSVESHRHKAWVVGEDLGTVPPEVPLALRRHGVRGLFVIQHELEPDPEGPLPTVAGDVVASVNTHDMPTFASYWSGRDIDDRVELGLLSGDRIGQERDQRPPKLRALVAMLRRLGLLGDGEPDAGAVLRACTEFLAGSEAGVVLLNLEDLWLEPEPQNRPSTTDECPNWRRKLRHGFEEFADDPDVLEILRRVDDLRRASASGSVRP